MKIKKILALSVSVLFIGITSSCGGDPSTSSTTTTTSTTTTSTTIDIPLPVDAHNIYMSEVYVSKNDALAGYVEISNSGTTAIDLTKYTLNIYKPTGNKINATVPLTGSLAAGKCFVVANPDSTQDVKEKADILATKFSIFGNNYMEIIHNESKKIVDTIGNLGFDVKYNDGEGPLLKKPSYAGSIQEFNRFSWIQTSCDYKLTLGNSTYFPIAEKELEEGPQLTSVEESRKFRINETTGGGGLAKGATVTNYVDGDTTRFAHEELGTSIACRYLGIDTPELDHRPSIAPEAWGNGARNFTNNILKNAKGIILQSNIGSFSENNGRALMWVWYTNTVNGDLSTYRCVNYEVSKAGFSEVGSDNANGLKYKSISYTEYFNNAMRYAKNNKLKIYGEEDPDWDYEENRPYNYNDFA
ncbi:MAG: thermonuclease family protein [Bacilli bacterium]